MKFQDPPIRTQFFPQQGTQLPQTLAKLVWIFSFPWIKYFQNISATLSTPFQAWPAGAPSTSQGIPGQFFMYDANFLYVCTGTNQWKRVPLSAF